MPAYNFMKVWVPKILDGSKAQTIRRRRKRPTVSGDTLYLYTGQRTKYCQLIGHAPCIEVTPVILYPWERMISIDGFRRSWGSSKEIALKDGFENIFEFYDFFKRYDKRWLDDFEIIKWDHSSGSWKIMASGGRNATG